MKLIPEEQVIYFKQKITGITGINTDNLTYLGILATNTVFQIVIRIDVANITCSIEKLFDNTSQNSHISLVEKLQAVKCK